jgi:hypothetical protein
MASASLVPLNEDTRRCAQACADCHQYCIETIVFCRQRGGAHAEACHLRMLLDCAELCQTTTDFTLRGSDLCPMLWAICAEAADRCALSCDRFGDDRQMRACAAASRRCAITCREMARVLSPGTAVA